MLLARRASTVAHLSIPLPSGPSGQLAKAPSPCGRTVILGSGWAGFNLLRKLSPEAYDVTLVSPRNYFVFTPLLAGTAAGTLEFRAVTESVRSYSRNKTYYEAACTGIDLAAATIQCTSHIPDKAGSHSFPLPYDRLIIAVGSMTNTFGIPGVREHAHFLKDVSDARRIRQRVIDCFEMAAQPGISEKEKRRLLHFAVVGGGPTGVELSAELSDLIHDDMRAYYPRNIPLVTITVYDVSPRILGAFDARLSEYASRRFRREGITIRTQANVSAVSSTTLTINQNEEVPYGLLVWAAGVAPNPLIHTLASSALVDGGGHLTVDAHLQVLDPAGQPIRGVYAIGDCAALRDAPLPATAQVANQQANYLGKVFKQIAQQKNLAANIPPFRYKFAGSMAYVGGWRAVAEVGDRPERIKGTGVLAWMFWRSAYLNMSVSWKNKILIPGYWLLSWLFGRDISRF